jgi:hypothetical protein
MTILTICIGLPLACLLYERVTWLAKWLPRRHPF